MTWSLYEIAENFSLGVKQQSLTPPQSSDACLILDVFNKCIKLAWNGNNMLEWSDMPSTSEMLLQ